MRDSVGTEFSPYHFNPISHDFRAWDLQIASSSVNLNKTTIRYSFIYLWWNCLFYFQKGMKKRNDEVEIGDDQPSTSRESASEEWNDDDEDEDPSYELFPVEDKVDTFWLNAGTQNDMRTCTLRTVIYRMKRDSMSIQELKEGVFFLPHEHSPHLVLCNQPQSLKTWLSVSCMNFCSKIFQSTFLSSIIIYSFYNLCFINFIFWYNELLIIWLVVL